MRGPVCCGLTPHLELALRTDLYGRPVVTGCWDGEVVAASEEALEAGVRVGMPVRQAEKVCPQAVRLEPAPAAAEALRERIAEALYDLAPRVEVRVEGVAWLDLEGIPKPGEAIREARGRLQLAVGAEPRLGLAPGPFCARLAAARARPGRLLKVDEASGFLAPLPASELRLPPEHMERLELLGLRTLGQVAAIGPRQLESQLGPEGRRAVLLAGGQEPDWLQPWQPAALTRAGRQLEPPVEDREALLFVARGLADGLAHELGLRGAGAKRVRLRLGLESGEAESRESLVRHPLSTGAELFGLLGSWLREWKPAGPVAEVTIELPELEAGGRRQLRLWTGGDGSREEVDAALERLQERHGEEVALKARPALLGSPLATQRFELESAWLGPAGLGVAKAGGASSLRRGRSRGWGRRGPPARPG